jgi:hypothetical protein
MCRNPACTKNALLRRFVVQRLEDYVLGSFPEGHLTEETQVLLSLGHGQEVVAGELSQLAREVVLP